MSATRPDPAPLTAEERADAEAVVAHLDALLASGIPESLLTAPSAMVRRLLAALDAAEARLADARREALEEAARLADEYGEDGPGLPLTRKRASLEISSTIRALAAPRPTEETTT